MVFKQVLLLLKASDRVAHDICHALEGCIGAPEAPLKFTLALRKWHALRPGREFRCFVRGHDLVGRPLACIVVIDASWPHRNWIYGHPPWTLCNVMQSWICHVFYMKLSHLLHVVMHGTLL